MRENIILFDIDRTLFDTDRYIERQDHFLIDHFGFDPTIYKNADQEYVNSLKSIIRFNLDEYIPHMSMRLGIDPDLFEKAFMQREVFEQSVFDDVHEVVEKLSAKFRIGIFSEGQRRFQEYKLDIIGIEKYIDPDLLFIFPSKSIPVELAKIPEKSLIVDDSTRILKALIQWGKQRPIWINRENSKEDLKVPSITSLRELPELLNQL